MTFTGKTLAVVALGDLTYIGARAWIDQNGGDSKTVHYLELPSAAALVALNDGRVDAVYVRNPVFAQMLASGQVRVLSRPADAVAKPFLITAFFATNAYAAKNPDALGRQVRASAARCGGLHQHPPCRDRRDDGRFLGDRSGRAGRDDPRHRRPVGRHPRYPAADRRCREVRHHQSVRRPELLAPVH